MVGICWRFSHLPLLLGVYTVRTYFSILGTYTCLTASTTVTSAALWHDGLRQACVSQLILQLFVFLLESAHFFVHKQANKQTSDRQTNHCSLHGKNTKIFKRPNSGRFRISKKTVIFQAALSHGRVTV